MSRRFTRPMTLQYEHHDFFDMRAHGSLAIDEIWAKFKAVIAHWMTNFVLQVAKVTKEHNPWITRDIIHIKQKIKRQRKSNKSSSVHGFQEKINYLSRSL